MLDRMHEPLRRKDPAQSVLAHLLAAFETGLGLFNLRAATAALYLHSARGRWLNLWADLYSYARDGRSDEALLQYMLNKTILERHKTTASGVAATLNEELGTAVSIHLGHERGYRFDGLGQESYFDYATTIDGDTVSDPVTDWSRNSSAPMPWQPGFGPGGLIIYIDLPWTPALQLRAERLLQANLKAGGSWIISWKQPAKLNPQTTVDVTSGLTYTDSGWGIDRWGQQSWS